MSAAPAPTLLAYAPTPTEDEPLDAWMTRVAQTLCTTTAGLHATLGLPRASSFSIVRDLTEEHLAALEGATGLNRQALRRMTLARWESIGLRPSTTQRGHGSGAWARSRGARHCPKCLHERGGLPRLQWYLHWSFACDRHHRLLLPDTASDGDPPAGHDPTSGQLGPDHPALRTQRALNAILDKPQMPVASLGSTRPAWAYMRDLAALTRMAATSALGVDARPALPRALPQDEALWSPIADPSRLTPMTSPARRLQEISQQPGIMALAATLAHQALAATSVEAASDALRWLPAGARGDAVRHCISRQLSWPLVRALDDPANRSRPTRLLHYRFSLARFDDEGSRRSPLDPAQVPASCWPSVTKHSTAKPETEISSVSASAALLAIGSTRGLNSALDRIGHPSLIARVRADWSRAFAFGDDPYFDLLLRLHQTLVENGVPINYARRRRSFPEPIGIGSRKARRIARELDVPLTERLVRHASWYVHELLTGSNVLLSEKLLNLWGAHRVAYRRQRAAWEDAPPPILLQAAEQELLRHRIDEPLTWMPIRDTSTDEWLLPAPRRHLLPGWTRGSRSMRNGAVSHRQDRMGYALDEAVALAAQGNTETARHIARSLTRFAAVARAGSLRGGASALGITGATLSVQMADLEGVLACSLLDRSGYKVALTGEGRHLMCLIERAEQQLIRAARTSKAHHPAPGGHRHA